MSKWREANIFAPYTLGEFWAETILGNVVSQVGRYCQLYWFLRYVLDVDGHETAPCFGGKVDIPPLYTGDVIMQDTHYKKKIRCIKLRYTSSHMEMVNDIIKKLSVQINCHVIMRAYDPNKDLGSTRFQNKQTREKTDAITMVLCNLSKLTVDSLEMGEDGSFYPGTSAHEQNPMGSVFESLHHLFCNTTDVPLRILINDSGIGTDWRGPDGDVYPIRVFY